MSFKSLQIRYQTARSLPAPYAYFYTLSLDTLSANALQVDMAITYPDRNDIDDDELIAEGYTRDDDFSWSGRLPRAWWEAMGNLVRKTRFQPINEDELDEDDDYWAITVEAANDGKRTTGKPAKPDDWQYLMQEMIQAIYEAMGRERPFELTYLNQQTQHGSFELRMVASFAERTVKITTLEDRREQSKTLPWSTLQQVMSQVYAHEYDPEDAQLKRPKREGQWLNLGTEEWYDVSAYRAMGKLLRDL